MYENKQREQMWPEAPRSCCLAIGRRYGHLEIGPNNKGGTTWLMWSPLCKTTFWKLFETSLILSAGARGSEILLFGVDSDCLAVDWQEVWTLGNWTEKQRGGPFGIPVRRSTFLSYLVLKDLMRIFILLKFTRYCHKYLTLNMRGCVVFQICFMYLSG